MRCVATKTPLDTRWLMLQYDGQYRWQHILAHPSFDERGNVVSWYMMGIEIDQQVRVEQALQTREREARELLNRVPAMLAIRGQSGIEFVSEQFLNDIGLPTSEVLGYKWLRVAHPEDRERVSELFSESIRTGRPSEWLWRIANKNGHYRWFHTHAAPFLEQDGSIRRWYSATTDIVVQMRRCDGSERSLGATPSKRRKPAYSRFSVRQSAWYRKTLANAISRSNLRLEKSFRGSPWTRYKCRRS